MLGVHPKDVELKEDGFETKVNFEELSIERL